MPRRGVAVHQRKSDGLWLATYELPSSDGKRVRKYVYGKTMSEAISKRKLALADVEAGIKPTPGREQTIGEWLDRWLDAKAGTGKFKPATLRNYQDVIDAYIKPTLGKIRLSALTAEHVEGMLKALATTGRKDGKPASTSTQKRAWSILTAALNQAVQRDYIRKNVAAQVESVSVKHAERPVLTAEQAKDLLVELSGDWLKPVYMLALHNGLREGEILGLRWSDVDLAAGTLTVTGTMDRTERVRVAPKTPKSRRTLKITAGVIDILREQQVRQNFEETQGNDGLVFTRAVRVHQSATQQLGGISATSGTG